MFSPHPWYGYCSPAVAGSQCVASSCPCASVYVCAFAVDREVGSVALATGVEVRGVGADPPEQVVERPVLHGDDDDGVERRHRRGGVEDAGWSEARHRPATG
jgi:hypothetical protein